MKKIKKEKKNTQKYRRIRFVTVEKGIHRQRIRINRLKEGETTLGGGNDFHSHAATRTEDPRKKVKRLGLKPATIWPNGME